MENIVPSWPGIHRDEPTVQFTNHDIEFKLTETSRYKNWIINAIDQEGYDLDNIDFVFCSDEFLLEINRTHLGHDDYTDIITFPMEENPISGEIYISIDRVRENAKTFQTSFDNELRRVMIHGVLHLCGYDDHEDEDVEEIRMKEEHYMGQFDLS